jgi:hypothetical protein
MCAKIVLGPFSVRVQASLNTSWKLEGEEEEEAAVD